MVEALDDMPHDFAQVLEVEQQSGLVQFRAGQSDTNLVVVAVRILALALVVAQVMARGKRIFDRDFEHDPSAAPVTKRRDRSSCKPSILQRQEACSGSGAASLRDANRATISAFCNGAPSFRPCGFE